MSSEHKVSFSHCVISARAVAKCTFLPTFQVGQIGGLRSPKTQENTEVKKNTCWVKKIRVHFKFMLQKRNSLLYCRIQNVHIPSRCFTRGVKVVADTELHPSDNQISPHLTILRALDNGCIISII